MMRKLTKLFRSEDGAGITEFALLAPVFVGMIISIGQFGVLYFAQSGLKSAVAEGARFASVFPRPTNDEIKTKISGSRFGMNPAQIVSTEVTDCVQGGRACIDIKMVYTVPMDIVPIAWPNQTLTEERRVFVAALPTEGDKSGTGGGKGGDDDGKGGGKDKDDDTGGDTGGGTDEPDCKGKKCDTDEPSDPEPSDPTPDEPTDPEPEPEPCKNAKKCGTDPQPTEPTPTEPTPTEPTPTEPDEPVCTKKNCK